MSSKVHDESKKQIDQNLQNGPLAERGCTDIPMCILFILSILFMAASAIKGYSDGKPERLAAAYDPDVTIGLACGIDYPDYDYLYFPILHPDYYNHTVCVKNCPKGISLFNNLKSLECKTNHLIQNCQKNCLQFDFNSYDSIQAFDPAKMQDAFNFSKLFCIYSTEVLFDRVCFPQKALEILDQAANFSQSADVDRLTAWVNDLDTAKWIILSSFFIAFIVSYFPKKINKFQNNLLNPDQIFSWNFCLALHFALFCSSCNSRCICLYEILGIKKVLIKFQFYQRESPQTTSNTTNTADTSKALEILSYIIFAWIALSLLIFICMFNKIRLAIAIIKTATLFVRDEFMIIFVPPVIAICVGIHMVWWIISVIFIVALGDIKGTGSSPFASVTWDENTRRIFWYFIFGGLWNNAFLLAMCYFIIASACCIWYFSQGPGQGAEGAIRKSVYRVFRYHLGSLAFGSLILAIVQFVRIVLEYVKWQTKQMGGDNKLTKCLLDCLSCIVACFERFIEFLNKNAYIQIALTGKSFCYAAKEAFETIWANSGRYALVAGIGGAFSFLGKAFITFATVFYCYFILTSVQSFKDTIFSPVIPCLVVFVIGYIVSLLFMTIYSMSCDTVLTCFVYDEQLNNGENKHCPETLREFFDQNEKKVQK